MTVRAAFWIFGLLLLAGCGRSDDPSAERSTVGELLGGTDSGSDFTVARRGVPIQLPRDHGPHPDFRSEWWYFTLVLEDEEGRNYGVQFTVFRQGLERPSAGTTPCVWCASSVWMAHLAVSDVSAEQHWSAERFSRGAQALAGARAEPFAVWLDGWQAAATDGAFLPLRIDAQAQAFGVDLQLSPGRLLLQGDAGWSPKGLDQASHYFSVSRMPVRGTLTVADRQIAVEGLGWLDREWSTSVLSAGQRGWDWMALQLDDGRDLVAFQLRRDGGERDPFDQGLLVDADGQSRWLRAADFELTPVRYWIDPQGGQWPVAFDVRLGGETLRVEAMQDDQLMDTLVRYWEGIVTVSAADGRRIGRGYLELTGYDQGAESP